MIGLIILGAVLAGMFVVFTYHQRKLIKLYSKESADETIEETLDSLKDHLELIKGEIDQFKDKYMINSGAEEARAASMSAEFHRVAEETKNLVSVLRGKAKVQGTWGEEMLSRILESAGLVPGIHFTEQYSVTDEYGKKFYPDVVVHLTGGRNIVVDSKVSLEQFIQANEIENITQKKLAMKKHVDSMKFHVSELVSKNYQTLIENSLDYVFMFVPHEGAFLAAVQEDETLLSWAYSQHIIIVNPSNLTSMLLIVKNLWQKDERERESEKIYESAVKLYNKFVAFAKNFEKMDSLLTKLRQTYDGARGQLSTGSANIIKQLSTWEDQYGIRGTESIPTTLKQ